MRRNKYNARRTVVDGIAFDSKKEADHYLGLKLLERAGKINGVDIHPRYPLQVNGTAICTYEADFSYTDVERGTFHVVDVKGMDTALSKMKRKLVKAIHGIDVEVVR